MTKEQFLDMIESSEVAYKRFTRNRQIHEVGVTDGIIACEYKGKFYLYIVQYAEAWNYKTNKPMLGKVWMNVYLKEFQTKEAANKYFQKVSQGSFKIERRS